MSLPTDAKARKAVPIYSGCFKYFPDALAAVAELSRVGNDQHNPGQPLHWAKEKSTDELDALARHLLDVADQGDDAADGDGIMHATKVAWRSLANLQRIFDRQKRSATQCRCTMGGRPHVEGCPLIAEGDTVERTVKPGKKWCINATCQRPAGHDGVCMA